MLSGIISVFLGWTDTAFLGYFMDQSAVGLYNAAFPTALILLIPHQAIGQQELSSFSELGAKDMSQEETLKTTTRWVFALTFPAFLIMVLFSSELITLLFGSEYASAGLALSILAFGNLVIAAAGRTGSLLKSNSHTKVISYLNGTILIFNILLNLYLIPLYGVVGDALATTLSNIIGNIIGLISTWRYERVHPFSINLVKILFSGILSLCIVYTLFSQLLRVTPIWMMIPAGLIFLLCYLMIVSKINGVNSYDKETIRKIRQKITETLRYTI